MNALRDMLNEFYENIPRHFRQPVIDAINAAEENEEDHVLTPLSQLIVNLDRGQSNQAINAYMTNPVTRGSSTRRFFFPHTLRENLYPEDVYVPPPRPTARLDLQRSPALPLFPEEPALVPPPHNLVLAIAAAPPRIDSFFQPGVPQAIAEMIDHPEDPDQAQSPSIIRQSPLLRDLDDGEIYE